MGRMHLQPYDCDRCSRGPYTARGLAQHKRDSPGHHLCVPYGRDYRQSFQLESAREGPHSYCRWCEEFFAAKDELEEHFATALWHCARCWTAFTNAMEEHLRQAAAHKGQTRANAVHCDVCVETFCDEDEYDAHFYRTKNHCGECRKACKTANGLHGHYKHKRVHAGRYCEECRRLFPMVKAREDHLAHAAVHRC